MSLARPTGPIRAVSFDFHDTIAIAPAWFGLEVRDLASATHAALVVDGALPPGPAPAALDAAYRGLRQEIHEHGRERDALSCVSEVFARLGLPVPATTAATIDRLMRATLSGARPRPGVVVAIERLAAAGLPIGVTSSAVYHPYLLWALDEFGLTSCLASIITSASCGFYKSRPEIYRTTAAALGTPLAGLVHIGDSFRFDVEPVARLGGRAVWLNLTGAPPPTPDLAALVVESLDGLAERVLAL